MPAARLWSVYILPQRMEKKTMIGTIVMFFLFVNYVNSSSRTVTLTC